MVVTRHYRSMWPSRVTFALLAMVLALVFTFPRDTYAREGSGGGILVSPARLVASVRPGEVLSPIRVKNTTAHVVELVAYVGRGEHRWDGSPVYLDSHQERLWGARHLELDKTHLRLAPGEVESITPRVGELPDIVGGFYPVIFLEMKQGQPDGITGISRVAIITLLQMAGSSLGAEDLAVTTLSVEQARPGEPISIFPLVTNHGDTHGTFQGYVDITHGEKKVTTRLPVAPATVLPGLGRRTALLWQPEELPVGTYEVNTHLTSGGRPVRADTWAFHVVEPYALATLRGDVVSITPKRTDADKNTDFRVVVHNSGTTTWRALGDLEVWDISGILEAQVPLEISEVEPGGSGSASGVLPALPPGRYTLRMNLASDGIPLVDIEQPLDVLGRDTIAQL